MEFTFNTKHDQRSMTAMARALRKTVRRQASRRTHIAGVIFALVAILCTIPLARGTLIPPGRVLVVWAAAVIILAMLYYEDRLNGYLACAKMLPGTESSECVFDDECYTSYTAAGTTEWDYERIVAMAEEKRYFVLILGKSHAQVYDKAYMTGGSHEEFCEFIREKTGLEIVKID